MTCSNPGRPCKLHDHEPERFTVEWRNRSYAAGWAVAILLLAIIFSTIPGLN